MELRLQKEDIIRPYDKAIGTDGSIAVLRGNLAPEGAVIKHTTCPKEMFHAVLRARPFDSEEECLDAVLKHKVQKGDAVFIRYEVRKAAVCRRCSILPRQSAATKSLERASRLSPTVVSPAPPPSRSSVIAVEAVDGRLIALVEEGDLIEIDVKERKLNIIGIAGERKSMEEIDAILKERRQNWKPREPKYKKAYSVFSASTQQAR